MATLNVTVPDAAVSRIQAAFGHASLPDNVWVNATQPEVIARLKAFLRTRVVDYETALADKVKADELAAEATW